MAELPFRVQHLPTQRDFDALKKAFEIPTVTAIPAEGLVDGQTVDYRVGSDPNTTLWRFRYDASETGTYKWKAVGAPPICAHRESAAVVSNTSYIALGLDHAIPLPGVYAVALTIGSTSNNTANVAHWATVQGAGQSASDSFAAEWRGHSGDNNAVGSMKWERALTLGPTGGGGTNTGRLEPAARSNNGPSNASFARIELRVQPLRVGPA